jgi:hypothetical protein
VLCAENASMALKEVVGSIPSGSTNLINVLQQVIAKLTWLSYRVATAETLPTVESACPANEPAETILPSQDGAWPGVQTAPDLFAEVRTVRLSSCEEILAYPC